MRKILIKPFRPVDVLRIGIIITIVSIILFCLNFYPTYKILPNWGYWDSTFSIESNGIRKVELGFIPKNHIFICKITIYSESPKVTMRLEDSLGNTVLASVLVDGSYSFVFQSPKDDFYYFYFDNLDYPYSLYDKTIFWQIFYYDNYPLVIQISGSILWVIGIIFIGSYFLLQRRKRTIQVPVATYEVIQKLAKSKGKTMEEIIREMVKEIPKKKPGRKRKSSK